MQAIEFETHIHNGIIKLPTCYQSWREGQAVKVILLSVENKFLQDKDIHRHVGKFQITQEPSTFQAAMRDEWL